jgi:type III pantothenate kinase
MNIITLDIGNTKSKAAIFENESSTPSRLLDLNKLERIIEELRPYKFIYSSVTNKKILNAINLLELVKDNKLLEMPINYSKSLGQDRLACSYFAFNRKEEKILVIDVGTFLTIDIVTKKGLEGGYIFPGIKTYLTSYNQGENLPVLDIDKDIIISDKTPNDTNHAIMGSLKIYLNSTIKHIIENNSPDLILLTGGGAETFTNLVDFSYYKGKIENLPHLIHSALHSIIAKL